VVSVALAVAVGAFDAPAVAAGVVVVVVHPATVIAISIKNTAKIAVYRYLIMSLLFLPG
jgi:hypothetical protein